MCSSIVCVAAVLLGIDAGWRPLPEGGVEYHIQIEPQVLESLKSGRPIYSDIPPNVKNVRAYKITVGREELTRELPPAEEVGSADAPAIPGFIRPDPKSKPIDDVQQAAHVGPAEAKPTPEAKSPSDQRPQEEKSQPEQPAPPWMPLTIALFTLFGSLGANVYLGWITWGTRSRYRALVRGVSETR